MNAVDVRYWHLHTVVQRLFALHMSAYDPKRTLFVMLAISPPVSRLPYQRIHFVLEKRAASQ